MDVGRARAVLPCSALLHTGQLPACSADSWAFGVHFSVNSGARGHSVSHRKSNTGLPLKCVSPESPLRFPLIPLPSSLQFAPRPTPFPHNGVIAVSRFLAASFCSLVLLAIATPALHAQGREAATIHNSSAVLHEIMRVPAKGIPQSLLSNARAIVIIPGMLKGGFVLGVRHGRGVALVRNEKNVWDVPRFVTMSGGSVGYQVGVQSTDVILVFMTKQSVEDLLRGNFTIGADATAAAGPVGRQVAAATDGQLKAEILSYSRSRGLFAGVSIDGSLLQVDHRAEAMFYGPQRSRFPESAARLVQTVAQYSDAVGDSAVPPDAGWNAPAEPIPRAPIRKQLADASAALSLLLNEGWRGYLALPAEVYRPDQQPSLDVLQHALGRYDKVAQDVRYRAIAERPEFQKTHRLLHEYVAEFSSSSESLELPPVPND